MAQTESSFNLKSCKEKVPMVESSPEVRHRVGTKTNSTSTAGNRMAVSANSSSRCGSRAVLGAASIAFPLFLFLADANFLAVAISMLVSSVTMIGLFLEKFRRVHIYHLVLVVFMVGQLYCIFVPGFVGQDDGSKGVAQSMMMGEKMTVSDKVVAASDGNNDIHSTVSTGADSNPNGDLTFSVVLPCAEEGVLMVKTARSIVEFTPRHILHEIVVVDDGSSTPLQRMVDSQLEDGVKNKINMVRHDQTQGLIKAKKDGGDVATGDVIVFLDCHVKPDPNWWRPIQRNIKENYKRVVVPTITNLNVDTWEEFGRPAPGAQGMSKCYLTFDAEFKWFTDDEPWVPVMSGGLLAISRQWWTETGGLDGNMVRFLNVSVLHDCHHCCYFIESWLHECVKCLCEN